MPRRDWRTTTADRKWERDDREELVGLAHDVAAHAETGPRLSGGDAVEARPRRRRRFQLPKLGTRS